MKTERCISIIGGGWRTEGWLKVLRLLGNRCDLTENIK